jgi:hypothetical protein
VTFNIKGMRALRVVGVENLLSKLNISFQNMYSAFNNSKISFIYFHFEICFFTHASVGKRRGRLKKNTVFVAQVFMFLSLSEKGEVRPTAISGEYLIGNIKT